MVQAGRNFALLTALAVGLGAPLGAQAQTQAAPAVQAAPPASRLPGSDVTLKTSDGWTLDARFHPAKPGKLTLILVHGTGRSKEIWTELARVLVRAGYGVMAFDLRGHGDSMLGPGGARISWRQFGDDESENDFVNIIRDIDASAAYLEAAKVPESGIGLIGDGLGGTLAVRYAATHPQTALVALISPGLDYQNVPLVSALRDYGNRPILLVYSQVNRDTADAAPLILAIAKLAAGGQNASAISTSLTSNFLFGRSISDKILRWLENPAPPAVAVSSAAAVGAPQDSSSTQSSPPEPPPQL